MFPDSFEDTCSRWCLWFGFYLLDYANSFVSEGIIFTLQHAGVVLDQQSMYFAEPQASLYSALLLVGSSQAPFGNVDYWGLS